MQRYTSEARCLPQWVPRWWLTAKAQERIADRVVKYHPTLSAGWEMRALVYGNTGNSQLYDCETTMRCVGFARFYEPHALLHAPVFR